jgi:hypothetical protein
MELESIPVHARTCGNHPQREAVARCPGCSGYFCRECVTEHEFRMVCAGCLERMREGGQRGEGRRLRLPVCPVVQVVLALGLVWLCAFALGRGLVRMPSDFHDGAVFGDVVESLFGAGGDGGG